jgi:predicted nucleotidyltransferase
MIEYLTAAEMESLVDLATIAHTLKTPLMLVGANARRLAFDIPFKFASPRTTRDWDFAAPMPNWQTFARFYELAVRGSGAAFRPGEKAHRIIHLRTGTLVDLIPFGGVSDAEGRIRWPQSHYVMSVLGFEEAFASSTREMLPNGTEIGIVTPAMLAALKILAFAERCEECSRDLQDVWFIMERYAHPAAQETRAFDELAEHFPDPACYEHLDSLLLGWDIGHQCRPATLSGMESILLALSSDDSRSLEPLLLRTCDLEERESARRRMASEFRWLHKGIDLALHT